jgi:hypothetical protein
MMSVEPVRGEMASGVVVKSRLVDPEEFCRLVVSMRSLRRCDDPQSGMRGLEDESTGETFVVEDVRLSNFLATRRPR